MWVRVRREYWKGAVAGMLGGILASFAMNRVHALWTSIEEDESAARRKKEQGGQLEKGRQQRRETSSPWTSPCRASHATRRSRVAVPRPGAVTFSA